MNNLTASFSATLVPKLQLGNAYTNFRISSLPQIQKSIKNKSFWIPAFAGMTDFSNTFTTSGAWELEQFSVRCASPISPLLKTSSRRRFCSIIVRHPGEGRDPVNRCLPRKEQVIKLVGCDLPTFLSYPLNELYIVTHCFLQYYKAVLVPTQSLGTRKNPKKRCL